jgi:putative spermidine/putrescine transport system substrate-binding protein
MIETLSRRRFLASCAAAGLGLGGCRRGDSPGAGGDFRGQTLRVFIYSGGLEKTMRSAFVGRLEKQTGATVVLDPGWWDSIPKLKASPPGQPAFDLVLTDATQGYPAIREGLFQKIDLTRIPNREKVSPAVLDNWVYRDGYGITFPDSVMTLAYRKDLVPFTPAGWDDLLRDNVRGQVALYNSFYMSLYTFACMKAAQAGKPGTAHAEVRDHLPEVLDFARANPDRVKFWWPTSTDMALSLARKECALGNMHSTEMLRTLRSNCDLAAVVPDADRAFTQLMWVIPEGTPHKELAETAINLLLSEEVQRDFAHQGCATPLLPIAQEIAAEDPLWKQFYPSTEAQLKTLQYYPYDAYFKDWDHIVEVWDRQVLRKG